MTERVVLAYSGGLDTSVGIGWIAEATGAEVIAVAVDVGQGGEDLDVIRQRALDCGAVEAYVADARDEFAEEYCMPALKANAMYHDKYPLVSALSSTPSATTCRSRPPRRTPSRLTRTCGAALSRPASSRTSGTPPPRTSTTTRTTPASPRCPTRCSSRSNAAS